MDGWMDGWMDICMYVYMYIYMHHSPIYLHIYMDGKLSIYTYTHIYVCMYVSSCGMGNGGAIETPKQGTCMPATKIIKPCPPARPIHQEIPMNLLYIVICMLYIIVHVSHLISRKCVAIKILFYTVL